MTALAALLAAAAIWWRPRPPAARLRPRPSRRRRVRRPRPEVSTGRDATLSVELFAACLAAGATTPDALAAAAVAAPAPVAGSLHEAVAELRSGVAAAAVWERMQKACPAWSDAARVCIRSTSTGAAIAAELQRVASRERARRAAARQQSVARASVWIVLPLGLCFLPAFVLVGVVPVLLAAAQGFLH